MGHALSAGASVALSTSWPLARSIASARRAVVVLPALPVTPRTGTGEKRSSRSAAPESAASSAAGSAGSGVQGESRRTSSPTTEPAREHAQRGELGVLAGGDRGAHTAGPASSSMSRTSGRRRIAATGRLSSLR